MKHRVVCTAGHIDHGKTSLVKALTGMDADRLSEEKLRGITIDIGFGFYGEDVTIIDLPGHERFVRNMVAGAATVDYAVLVVAADDGPMPQTLEHLDILNLLGVKDGMVAVTKADLVDQDWLELVCEDIRDKVSDSFLAGKPVMALDSVSGRGVSEFKAAFDAAIEGLPPRKTGVEFREPVDRSFSIRGFGTVITGTVISGKVSVKDTVELIPSGKKLKVRGIQVHGKDVQTADPGFRAALNLSGVDKWEIERGNVLAEPGLLKPSDRLDCKIELLKNSLPLKHRQRLRFHIGTAEIIGRILLLEGNLLEPGGSAYAQLELENQAAALRGDRFVFRTYSPQVTIGGGVVLMSAEEKHRRREKKLINLLSTLADGDDEAIIKRILENAGRSGIPGERMRFLGSFNQNVFADIMRKLTNSNQAFSAKSGGIEWFAAPNAVEEIKHLINEAAKKFHKANPVKPGFSLAELKALIPEISVLSPFIERALEDLVKSEEIKRSGSTYSLPGHKIKLSPAQETLADSMIKFIEEAGLAAFRAHGIAEAISADVEDVLDMMAILESLGKLVRLDTNTVISRTVYEDSLLKLRDSANEGRVVILAEAVKALNSSRRATVILLEYLDKIGVTERSGDERKMK